MREGFEDTRTEHLSSIYGFCDRAGAYRMDGPHADPLWSFVSSNLLIVGGAPSNRMHKARNSVVAEPPVANGATQENPSNRRRPARRSRWSRRLCTRLDCPACNLQKSSAVANRQHIERLNGRSEKLIAKSLETIGFKGWLVFPGILRPFLGVDRGPPCARPERWGLLLYFPAN